MAEAFDLKDNSAMQNGANGSLSDPYDRRTKKAATRGCLLSQNDSYSVRSRTKVLQLAWSGLCGKEIFDSGFRLFSLTPLKVADPTRHGRYHFTSSGPFRLNLNLCRGFYRIFLDDFYLLMYLHYCSSSLFCISCIYYSLGYTKCSRLIRKQLVCRMSDGSDPGNLPKINCERAKTEINLQFAKGGFEIRKLLKLPYDIYTRNVPGIRINSRTILNKIFHQCFRIESCMSGT